MSRSMSEHSRGPWILCIITGTWIERFFVGCMSCCVISRTISGPSSYRLWPCLLTGRALTRCLLLCQAYALTSLSSGDVERDYLTFAVTVEILSDDILCATSLLHSPTCEALTTEHQQLWYCERVDCVGLQPAGIICLCMWY
jgi:hypothetical protein